MSNTCFPVLNLTLFTNWQAQANNCQTAEELQALANEVMGQVNSLYSTMQSQISYIGAMESLLTPPTADPSKIVTWITSFITNFLGPYLTVAVTYAAQVTALTAAVASLTAEINSIASTKFPGVSITVPSLSITCSLT